jgi:hypothetical protein
VTNTVSTRPARVDWECTIGDDAELVIDVVDDAGDPVDLAGRTWQWRLPTFGSMAAVDLDSHVDTSSASTGRLRLPLTDTRTAALAPRHRPWYLRDDTNDWTLLAGDLHPALPGAAGVTDSTTGVTVQVTGQTVAVTVTGTPGRPGDPGEGVPAGGSAGEVLAKATGDDFDTEWIPAPAGGGGGAWSVQVGTSGTLTVAEGDTLAIAYGCTYVDLPSAITEAGRTVKVLAASGTTVRATGGQLVVPRVGITPGASMALATDEVVEFVAVDLTAFGFGGLWYGTGHNNDRYLLADDAVGLDLGLSTVHEILQNHEGMHDRGEWISAFALTDVADLAIYLAGPVAVQPTLSEGTTPVAPSRIHLFNQTDPTENGSYSVLANGQWERHELFPIVDGTPEYGNGFRLFCSAPGTAGDGAVFEWTDDDMSLGRRASHAYPTSREGRWMRSPQNWRDDLAVSAGGPDLSDATPQPLGTAAAGTSPDAARADHVHAVPSSVVGGQDEGTNVVGTTSSTSLLDSTINITGAAGDVFEVVAAGDMLNNTGSGRALVLTLVLGGVDLLTITTPNAGSQGTRRDWLLNATLRVEAASDVNAAGALAVAVLTNAVGTGQSSAVNIAAGTTLDLRTTPATSAVEVQLKQLSIVRRRA